MPSTPPSIAPRASSGWQMLSSSSGLGVFDQLDREVTLVGARQHPRHQGLELEGADVQVLVYLFLAPPLTKG